MRSFACFYSRHEKNLWTVFFHAFIISHNSDFLSVFVTIYIVFCHYMHSILSLDITRKTCYNNFSMDAKEQKNKIYKINRKEWSKHSFQISF